MLFKATKIFSGESVQTDWRIDNKKEYCCVNSPKFLAFARKGVFLTRGLSFILRCAFPLLKFFIPAFKKSPCYWQALLQLGCISSKEQLQYRICILLHSVHPSNLWGHVWLEKGNQDIQTNKRRCDAKIVKIAENNIYKYYATVLGPEVKPL